MSEIIDIWIKFNTSKKSDFLSQSEFVKVCNNLKLEVCIRTMQYWRKKGIMPPAVRWGRKCMIPKSSLEQVISLRILQRKYGFTVREISSFQKPLSKKVKEMELSNENTIL